MNSLGFKKKEKDTKVVLSMSGGVDSSVAAAMLKKEGYNVIGITLKLYNQTNYKNSKSCCAGLDIEDARKVAKQYNFQHLTFDYQDKFFDGVINNFIESYGNGETPVPCPLLIRVGVVITSLPVPPLGSWNAVFYYTW